jgi:hypothetical protein
VSLVSEALKKAEREAAARDARGKGQPPPFEAPLQPYRARRSGGTRMPLFAALGAGAALVTLALMWWSSPQKAPASGDRPAASALAGTSAATSVSAPERSSLEPRAGAQPSPPSAPVTPGLATAATAPAPAAPSASEPPATPPATPPLPKATAGTTSKPPNAREPAAPRPSAPLAAAAPATAIVTTFGPGDYLRRVDFPDGSKLELGGIVYSETSPFAYLNGRLVGVGEFVEGRRIDRIERDKVILSGDAGTLTLRLKAP